ncbi:MAG: transposase, partial [Candidatus Nitrosotenuis sp.]
MSTKRKILSNIPTESILIGILHLIGLLSLYNDADQFKRGRPYVYPTTVMIRCYVVRIWMRIPSNNALHYYFSVNTKHGSIMKACGLHSLPDRRTFDRRFKILPFRCLITAMGARFELENLADCKIVADDGALIGAKGHVWHHTHIKSNFVPRPGIDTDARWGFARTKGWIFGYKLHMCCSTGKLVVPLSAELSRANMHNTQMYHFTIQSLPDTVRYVVADAGYDDQNLYDFTRQRGARLVCPIRRYRHT